MNRTSASALAVVSSRLRSRRSTFWAIASSAATRRSIWSQSKLGHGSAGCRAIRRDTQTGTPTTMASRMIAHTTAPNRRHACVLRSTLSTQHRQVARGRGPICRPFSERPEQNHGGGYRHAVLSDHGHVEPLGDLIRARRRQLGLSQSDIAEAVGALDRPTVTRQEVARWERGKRIPRGRSRKALAQALGLPSRQLDLAAAVERARRAGHPVPDASDASTGQRLIAQASVSAIRATLLDHASSAFLTSIHRWAFGEGASSWGGWVGAVMWLLGWGRAR